VEQLMHTLAHELKSPIAAIQASAELLQEDMPPAERHQFLASILEQNARQRQLIDKLLALVRVEKQQRLDHPERLALAPLLAQVAQDATATLAAREVRLRLDADELAVAGDALLLRQAWAT
jgi:two-component system sensor histidine kinase CreC